MERERDSEERREAELEEVEEAIWPSSCVGGALYTQLSTADVNVFPMETSTFHDRARLINCLHPKNPFLTKISYTFIHLYTYSHMNEYTYLLMVCVFGTGFC